MILAPFAIGLSMAASVASGGPTAHTQQPNNHQIIKADQPKLTTVLVNQGDTLNDIAAQYQTTYVRLFDANTDIQNPDLIYPGEQIRIPAADEQLDDRPLPSDAPSVANSSLISQTSASQAKPAPALLAIHSAPVAGCGDNSYANFIYSHESGCRTTAMSSNGCYGIGQACPASKIAYCGADYACQNAYFTAYAGKYGGWAGAYAFWVAYGWW